MVMFELNTFICLFCIFFQKVIMEFKGGELHKGRTNAEIDDTQTIPNPYGL